MMERSASRRRAKESVRLLDEWVWRNGWSGYDPYDIKGVPSLIWLQRYGLLRKGFNVLAEVFPYLLRKLFRVEPAVNAKAMALLARAYLNLYRYRAEERYLRAARDCLSWLMEHSCGEYSGPCWGYPFDWQTEVFIPRGTPSGVVTSMAAEAFLEAYQVFGERSYLDFAAGACEFMMNDLRWDQIAPDSGCFSYTPIDEFHVHNANLWVAAAIYRTGVFVPRTALLKRAGQALRYTLDGQHSNGAWPYRGPPDHSPGVIDHYHTGFVLRALESIYRIEPGPEILDALRKGGEYYREYLFADGRIPRRTDRKVYPIDIHSCSEAILCCTILGERFPRFSSLADVVLEWTVNEMQDPGGFFYYRKYPLYTSRAAFLRWGQAWMMLALSEYLIRTGDGSRRQVEHSTISEAGPPR